MKRSEMIEHLTAELEEMLESLENRPKTRPYVAERFSNEILDMIEGLGMLPPRWIDDKSVRMDVNIKYDWEPEDK